MLTPKAPSPRPDGGATLADVGPQAVSAAEIVHRGKELVLPENMTIPQGIDLLKRRMEYMAQTVTLSESIDVFPHDGAAALERVLVKLYGWAPQIGFIRNPGTMFAERVDPETIGVEVSYGVTRQVPWGRFSLPNIPGWVETNATKKNGRFVFQLGAETLRQHEADVRELFSEVAKELRTNSIYLGQAFRLRFRDDNRKVLPLPNVNFMDTEIDETKLVFSEEVYDAINTNLFTPLQRLDDCILNNIPIKRGVLLGGHFGTGKTLAAKVASKFAVQAGITFIYCERADELVDCLHFATAYQTPMAVIFCEDVDRVTSGERDIQIDDLLNIIDGIDSKNGRIMVVLTTNDLESINQAMLRPGRLDAVINVTPPDAAAVERLIRVYGGNAIAPDADLKAAGAILANQVPAIISEAVKRAKLAQLRRQPKGELVTSLSGEAIAESASSMKAQVDLLTPKKVGGTRHMPLMDLLIVEPDSN